MNIAHQCENCQPDDGPLLHGVNAIAVFLNTPATLTKLALETRILPGIKVEGDWVAERTDLEEHRAPDGGGRRVPIGPRGYPTRASFV